MTRLDVLLTSRSLAHRGGSEMYARDLALGLVRRGHRASIWSAEPGALADELRGAGVRVVERLSDLGAAPDLVHGQQHLELAVALLRFPGTPAVLTCHAARDAESEPLPWPAVRRHVAVDRATHERLLAAGVPAAIVETVPNAVDLERFQPRAALPTRPRRALVFSNYVRDPGQIAVLRQACAEAGLELEIIGSESGHPHAAPEAALPLYDLVFAKARCALEAMAVGCAVVLCDEAGCGPLVTVDNFHELRRDNFGFRCLDRPLAYAPLGAEIARYDAAQSAQVRDIVRREASLDEALTRLLGIYAAVLAEATGPAAAAWSAELPAVASDYLLRWAPHWRSSARWEAAAQRAGEHALRIQAASRSIAEQSALRADEAERRASLAAATAEEARGELRRAQRSLTWRLREGILRLPGVPGLYRRLRRRAVERAGQRPTEIS